MMKSELMASPPWSAFRMRTCCAGEGGKMKGRDDRVSNGQELPLQASAAVAEKGAARARK